MSKSAAHSNSVLDPACVLLRDAGEGHRRNGTAQAGARLRQSLAAHTGRGLKQERGETLRVIGRTDAVSTKHGRQSLSDQEAIPTAVARLLQDAHSVKV